MLSMGDFAMMILSHCRWPIGAREQELRPITERSSDRKWHESHLWNFKFSSRSLDLRKIKILLARKRNQNHHFVSSKIFLDEESASLSYSTALLEYSQVRKRSSRCRFPQNKKPRNILKWAKNEFDVLATRWRSLGGSKLSW